MERLSMSEKARAWSRRNIFASRYSTAQAEHRRRTITRNDALSGFCPAPMLASISENGKSVKKSADDKSRSMIKKNCIGKL